MIQNDPVMICYTYAPLDGRIGRSSVRHKNWTRASSKTQLQNTPARAQSESRASVDFPLPEFLQTMNYPLERQDTRLSATRSSVKNTPAEVLQRHEMLRVCKPRSSARRPARADNQKSNSARAYHQNSGNKEWD